jgi:hypothetical protein
LNVGRTGIGRSARRATVAGFGLGLIVLAGLAVPRSAAALLPAAPGGATPPGDVLLANAPPVAHDDPAAACFDTTLFGGAFPVVEDHRSPDDTDLLVLGGACGLLANDTDADGDSLSYEILSQPPHGEVIWVDDQFFAYRPDPDFSTEPGDQPGGTWLSDSFTYRAFDGTDWSEPATMRFWVAPINDPPTFTPGPTVAVDEDSGAYSAPWATEVSPGPPSESGQAVRFEITAVDANGVFLVSAERPDFDAEGNLTFTPGPNEHGIAHVTVRAVDDGGLTTYPGVHTAEPPDDTSDSVTFDIVVASVNDGPTARDDAVDVTEDQANATSVAVLADDTDPDGDVLEVSAVTDGAKGVVTIVSGNHLVSYKPNANAFGADSFTYTVSDGNGGTDTATVAVTIAAVNDPPGAVDDGDPTPLPVGAGLGPTALDVLANDTFAPDGGETLAIIGLTQGAHGSVAIADGGTNLTYDPAGLYEGPDAFTYTISDGHGGTDTATVMVLVTADVTAPVTSRPRVVLVAGSGASEVRAAISWSAVETQSGIATYRLQRQIDGGTWTTVALQSPSSTSLSLVLPGHHTYRFRVRATDGAGNVGEDAIGRPIRL